MTRDCITCLIRCKILHWIKIVCCNCIDISLRQWMQTGCFFQKPSSIRIICFDSCILRFVNFCNNTVFIVVIGKCVCTVSIYCFDNISVSITLILCCISHDINAFGHFIILIFAINHIISDFIHFIGLTIGFHSICLYCILFIIVIGVRFDQRITIIFFQSRLFLCFIIGINLFQTRCIGQPIYRAIIVIHDLVCHFIVAVCNFTKSAFSIIFIGFCSARYACCRYQLKISVICISNHTTCGGIFNTGNPRMFFIAIIGDRISSASGICHYTLVICHRRDG